MEDEEHVIFGCPEYNTCRLKLLNIDDQESISKFLWDIRNIRVNHGGECYFLS